MFRVAQEHAPSIIFIDEIDAVATKRFASSVVSRQACSLLGGSNVQHSLVLNFLNRYDTTSGGEKEIQRTMWLGHEYSKVSMANPAPPTPRPENSFARGSAFPRQFQ